MDFQSLFQHVYPESAHPHKRLLHIKISNVGLLAIEHTMKIWSILGNRMLMIMIRIPPQASLKFLGFFSVSICLTRFTIQDILVQLGDFATIAFWVSSTIRQCWPSTPQTHTESMPSYMCMYYTQLQAIQISL